MTSVCTPNSTSHARNRKCIAIELFIVYKSVLAIYRASLVIGFRNSVIVPTFIFIYLCCRISISGIKLKFMKGLREVFLTAGYQVSLKVPIEWLCTRCVSWFYALHRSTLGTIVNFIIKIWSRTNRCLEASSNWALSLYPDRITIHYAIIVFSIAKINRIIKAGVINGTNFIMMILFWLDYAAIDLFEVLH